jgi:hypothetical protein
MLRLYRPLLLADFGHGVLDAMVETAAYVLRNISEYEDRQLTLEILPSLYTIPTDRQGAFSITKYQRHRRGLKRHQATQELKRLQENRYLSPVPGHYIRYEPNLDVITKAEAPTPLSYPSLICFHLLAEEDKDRLLLEILQDLTDPRCFVILPESLSQIPNSPFCYWVSNHIRQLFTGLPRFESEGREVRLGDHPDKDFRYLRLFWEVQTNTPTLDWKPYQKGGEYSPFYYDIHLVVNWDTSRQTYRGFYGRPGRPNERPSNYQYFFRPGLTWPRSTVKGLNVRCLCSGVIFADKGPCAFVPEDNHETLLGLLGLMNSRLFEFLLYIRHGSRAWEVGLVRQTPIPNISVSKSSHLCELARASLNLKRNLDTANETSHVFHLPALLQVPGDSLTNRFTAKQKELTRVEQQLAKYQCDIDEIAFRLYRISENDRQTIEETVRTQEITEVDDTEIAEEEDEIAPLTDARHLVIDLFSYNVGCAFGRWDIRFATGEKSAPVLPDPFVPLPVGSPSMLTSADGFLLPETPPNYPIMIAWDGILVDDQNHPNDIVRRVQQVLEVIWQDPTNGIEQEACEILGVRDLQNYFQRPTNFFQDHLKRYFKSRRKAPIYWPLSTTSGSYTVWIYYHRLTDQTLYTVVNRYIEPKITEVERTTINLQKQIEKKSGREASELRDKWQEARTFFGELQDFRQELLRIAQLPYKPNLNDGVIINAAPLHRLFRLRQWAQEAKKCWDSLEKGEYDWAHLAYTIWPNRVREVCRHDRSIAIAHGLEELYEEVLSDSQKSKKGKRGSRKKAKEEGMQ